MDNPAEPSDVVALGLTGYEDRQQVVQAWLDVAWRALQREVRTLVASVEAATVSTEDVIDVVAGATLRVLRNPEGVTDLSAGIDDYNESLKYATASQDVYFTAAELRRVSPEDPYLGSGWSGSLKYCG